MDAWARAVDANVVEDTLEAETDSYGVEFVEEISEIVKLYGSEWPTKITRISVPVKTTSLGGSHFTAAMASIGRAIRHSLSQSFPYSTSPAQKKSTFVSKLGIVLGITGLGILGLATYDRFAALPEELQGLNFPLPSRWYIRRALCPANEVEETARLLDLAMQNVLNSGLGSASPESTALVLYLTRRYMEEPTPSLPDLEAAYIALTFKPHVGEAIKEEKARLLKSFEVAHRLCQVYSEQGNHEKVHYFAARSIDLLDNCPPYLVSTFSSHPLRAEFMKYSQQ